MRITYNIIGFLVASSVFVSCVRKNDIIDPTVLPPGGKGGMATLVVTPQHHKVNVGSAKIFIKYAATTMPDPTTFDDSANVNFDLGRPTVSFKSLTEGDYYIYATGVDNTLPQDMDQVMGGAHFRVIDTLEKTYDLYLQMDNPIHHK